MCDQLTPKVRDRPLGLSSTDRSSPRLVPTASVRPGFSSRLATTHAPLRPADLKCQPGKREFELRDHISISSHSSFASEAVRDLCQERRGASNDTQWGTVSTRYWPLDASIEIIFLSCAIFRWEPRKCMRRIFNRHANQSLIRCARYELGALILQPCINSRESVQ